MTVWLGSSLVGLDPVHRLYYFLEPSVAQPPFPLQEFFPLQPFSLVLQPPLPLQEFLPSQACFSFLSAAVETWPADADKVGWELLDDGAALRRAMVPPSKPVKAAVSIRELFEIFICTFFLRRFVGLLT